MASSDEIIIGIDLGTTFSLVAYSDARGPQVIRDANGDGRVPSVVHFAPGRTIIGWEARAHAVEHPHDTVYSVKRLMGIGLAELQRELPFLSYRVGKKAESPATAGRLQPKAEKEDTDLRDVVAVEIDGQWLTPQEISSLILRELKARAERHFGREVRKAVITVPAYFDDSQRQATRDAGRIAGLEVVRIVNEPTAAALAYGIGAGVDETSKRRNVETSKPVLLPIGDKSKCTAESENTGAGDGPARSNPQSAIRNPQSPSTIAVFDLGGGTFDVSILRLEDGVFEVLGTHGDTHLGGDDFDRAIILLVQREVAERFNVTIDAPGTRQALRLLAEQVKIRLSTEAAATIELDLGQNRVYRREISRGEFESLIAPNVERTIDACRAALKAARLGDTSCFVGTTISCGTGVPPGSTGETPDSQLTGETPVPQPIDRVVLVGGSTRIPFVRQRVGEFFGQTPYTALNPDEVVALGAAVQAQILSGGRRDLLLLDVTPLSLGIETMGGAMGKLIMANTRVPCRASEGFTTFIDGQTNVKINVLQGERELAADCRSLGVFELRGIPPMPAGIPKIEVTFLIDANGILSVTALEQRSGQKAEIQVIPAHGLTPDEVKQMTLDAVRFAREDMTAHRLIDLRNQVEFDTHKTEQMLAKAGHQLPAGEREAIEEGIRVLRRLAQTCGDADKLHQALDMFDKQTIRLAELAMTAALKS